MVLADAFHSLDVVYEEFDRTFSGVNVMKLAANGVRVCVCVCVCVFNLQRCNMLAEAIFLGVGRGGIYRGCCIERVVKKAAMTGGVSMKFCGFRYTTVFPPLSLSSRSVVSSVFIHEARARHNDVCP
jgi:hypothetical protein